MTTSEKLSARRIAFLADAERSAHWRERSQSAEASAKRSAALVKRWANPAARAAQSTKLRAIAIERYKDPAERAKTGAAIRASRAIKQKLEHVGIQAHADRRPEQEALTSFSDLRDAGGFEVCDYRRAPSEPAIRK